MMPLALTDEDAEKLIRDIEQAATGLLAIAAWMKAQQVPRRPVDYDGCIERLRRVLKECTGEKT
jgi:hypothetical protein